jgi:hypothetical protein
MSQVELLELVLGVLDQLGIESMLVGSHASSFYGEARSTHDIDLVIDLDPAKINELVDSFDSSRYYLSPQALREGRMANLIDTQTGDKVDFFLLAATEQAQSGFSRRCVATILGVTVSIASPEDTVLAKLDWNRQLNGSERQISDVREVLRNQGSKLDIRYLRNELESRELWDSFQENFGELDGSQF